MTFIDRAVDTAVVRRLIAETTREIIGLKRALRTTWTRPMAAEQKALAALKDRATLLCIVRAGGRGRYHISAAPRGVASWDRDRYHREMAARAIDRYGLGADHA